MMYSGDDFYGDDETSGEFMGCMVCGQYECPGECEEPDEPDVHEDDDEPVLSVEIAHELDTLDELPY